MDDNLNKTPQGDGTPNAANNVENKGGEKTFTAEEHQAELDRVAAKTREEERKKTEKLIAEASQKAAEEAARQAKLSEDERNTELAKKREEDLAAKERELNIRGNTLLANSKLQEAEIDITVSEFLVSDNEETTIANVDRFTKAFNKALENSVAKRLAGTAPKALNTNSNVTGTKATEIPTMI